jgi:hypothetical protein
VHLYIIFFNKLDLVVPMQGMHSDLDGIIDHIVS